MQGRPTGPSGVVHPHIDGTPSPPSIVPHVHVMFGVRLVGVVRVYVFPPPLFPGLGLGLPSLVRLIVG